eukprot:CAMPEP_0115759532 /NCGR_PEP_ID=MMETSP0272-20121206/99519_1 /TAXON_ID=71861 /ORGANISM="Scrippsiella trochoidea, Strain CCMP3099" /LENGTH=168 /DNA_ID=CAMNT_0003205143 /DNA_START=252 /DNA_END=754 /DNA_ORIENTATION=-
MSNLNLYATLALPLLVRVQDPHRNLGRRWCATPEIRLCVVDGSDSGPLAFPAVHRGDEKVVQDQDPKLRRSALASLCSPALLLGGPSLPAAALHIVTNAAESSRSAATFSSPSRVVSSKVKGRLRCLERSCSKPRTFSTYLGLRQLEASTTRNRPAPAPAPASAASVA